MATRKPTAEELALIIEQFGEKVARRVYEDAFHAASDERSFKDFYKAVASMDANDPLPQFDPTGWNRFYANDPRNKHSLIRHLTDDAALEVHAWLISAIAVWGDWVCGFLAAQLLDKSIGVFDEIAADEGEFISDDGHRYCGWYKGWKGWQTFAVDLTDNELRALRMLILNEPSPRHPEPGSPEAEAFMAERDARIAAGKVAQTRS
ncbi:hypothetical protein [Paraburkholderia phosphatilytica]|uniref:hypothetical protein n=1 Tax=Paraburkholderia phosphatilytica TaxID=2282883 RepID=UPI000E4C147F|nr:hypothetical protein [Paraburkholderia phosphatilytica]